MPTLTKKKIPFFRHDLGEPELEAIREVLEGPILTTGETVARFESRFAKYLGRSYALGVSSCTGAIHLSLLALGIGPGDEVITTPMTFIATATAILEAGAKPVFVDVEEDTGNLDVRQVETVITKRTKAIMPVHLFGLMCDMKRLREIADRHQLYLIEDAAHCIEGERDGIRPGELSETACFSFYATKSLTCGEGGAVVTDDPSLLKKLRLLRLHGMTQTAADREREGYKHWDMTLLGWKYNMDNIQAALLLPQLERLESNRIKRTRLAEQYEEGFRRVEGVRFPAPRFNSRHARHLFPIWIEPRFRDKMIEALQNEGIGVVVNYRPVHLLSYFAENFGYRPGDFPHAERIGNETLSLPLYASMPGEHADQVIQSVKRILETLG